MKRLSRFIIKHALAVALLGTGLCLPAGYFSIQLFKNLRTDFEELLPAKSRSVLDLNEVSGRLESVDNLIVVILSKDTKASKRFVDDLAGSLKQLPSSVVSIVEYKIDEELAFFKKRLALYIETPDLIRVRDYLRERVSYERELRNPLNIFNGIVIPEPNIDIDGLRAKYEGRTRDYAKYPGGYYATADETARAILVYMPGKSFGVDHSNEFRNQVISAIQKLKPESYSPDLEYHFAGGVEDMIEEHGALVADLELSTAIVCLLVGIAMLLYFRNLRSTISLIASLLVGVFWSFGVSYFAVGYLNANSAFMGSIVIGNGINFGIILLARYVEERRAGRPHEVAIETAMSQTATATLTAALAASLSYGSLILTSFRGFSQFGIIGLMGMILCWLSSYTLIPAYLTLFERFKPLFHAEPEPQRNFVSGLIANGVARFPGIVFATTLTLTLVSVATFSRFDKHTILESDLSKLRDRHCMTQGSYYYAVNYLDKIFQRYMSPTVILAKERDEGEKIAAFLRKKQQTEGRASLIASVQTLADFIPRDQANKIKILNEIHRILPPSLFARLSPADQAKVAPLLNTSALQEVHESDLPQLILKKFKERSGAIGNLVLVEPPMEESLSLGDNLKIFTENVRAAADVGRPGTPVAGSLAITYDMNTAIAIEGPRATLCAFLAVVLLVVVLFRDFRTIYLCLFALILGGIWLAGFILGFGHKINFLNFIALPITFGIGVDYGVNIFQRYRQEKGADIINVIRNTGGAVMLCSLTTVIGYSSLLIASNQGFVSFGTLAVMGELTCVAAAIFALPSFLLVLEKVRKKIRKTTGTKS